MKTSPRRPHLAIIIVSWNCKQKLAKCLDSLAAHPPSATHQTVVVDNGSQDGTVSMLRTDYGNVVCVDASENLGFAKANNRGTNAAPADYYLFLNPDTVVRPQSLNVLLEAAQNDPKLGVVAPKLVYPEGMLQRSAHRRFPGFISHHVQYNFLLFTIIQRLTSGWDYTLYGEPSHNNKLSPKHVMGAAMLIPNNIFQAVGRFDESFFLYFEETDLCYRIHRHHPLLYLPEAVIEHHFGGSSNEGDFGQGSPYYMESAYRYFRLRGGLVYAYLMWLTTALTLLLNFLVLLAFYPIIAVMSTGKVKYEAYHAMGMRFTKRALTWHLSHAGKIA